MIKNNKNNRNTKASTDRNTTKAFFLILFYNYDMIEFLLVSGEAFGFGMVGFCITFLGFALS